MKGLGIPVGERLRLRTGAERKQKRSPTLSIANEFLDTRGLANGVTTLTFTLHLPATTPVKTETPKNGSCAGGDKADAICQGHIR